MIVFAFHDAFKATDGVFQGDVFTRRTGEYFCHEERLGQEALDLTSTRYHQFVFFRQFIHTQDGDDVFQFLITLQDGLNATRGVVVFLTNHQRVQLTAGGVQRVNGRVDTQRRDLTAQYHGCIKVSKGGGW